MGRNCQGERGVRWAGEGGGDEEGEEDEEKGYAACGARTMST